MTVPSRILVESQIPQTLLENDSRFLDFMEAYYEWVESVGLEESLAEYGFVDTAPDDFVQYFVKTYLENVPLQAKGDLRLFVKHANDFYNVRGTESSVKLLFNLLYNTDARVNNLNKQILKASDGDWYVPTYLELTVSNRTTDFVGKQIYGVNSGSFAFAEYLVRKFTNGAYYDVLYLSNLRGDFETDELITDSANIDNCPSVVGSLNSVVISDGGKNNQIGDIFTVSSVNGKRGKARVSALENTTGRVNFTLNDGGTAYTVNANALVSNVVLNLSSITGTFAVNIDRVRQKQANVVVASANNFFANNTSVTGYTSGTWIKQASGKVVNAANVGSNTILTIVYDANSLPAEYNFAFADTLRSVGNTISGIVVSSQDVSASGFVMGVNSTAVGIIQVTGGFITGNRIVGSSSNASANIVSQSTGTGATFDIGNIFNTETVLINSDLISGNNVNGIPYRNIRLDGSGSGEGRVNNVTVVSGGTGYTNGAATFTGGGAAVTNVVINVGGTLYKNGEHLVFTSNTGGNAAGIITTNTAGAITSITISPGGFFQSRPNVSVTTSNGINANLTAVLNSNSQASGTVTTNSTGSILSVSISNTGGDYYTYPVVTRAGAGSGANLQPVMVFGYGFPKNVNGTRTNIINSVLTRVNATIGTIKNITGISPGVGYNQNPFVEVVEPFTATLERKDYILTISPVVPFIVGESINQDLTTAGKQLTFTGITGNTTFDISENITQGAATGTVYYRDSTVVRVGNVTGTFVNTSNSTTRITGTISNAVANVTAITNTSILTSTRGIVKSQANNLLLVKRTSFNTSYSNGAITGSVSGASANVTAVEVDHSSPTAGLNANVTALTITANGVATTVDIIDSGFGFMQNEPVTLINSDNEFVLDGYAELTKQGKGEGRWTSTKGFLNSDMHIHDGDYYQAFSYEIVSSVSLNRYADILTKLIHVSGTKMFGKVETTSEITDTLTYASSTITQA